jgi:hypothetical protein
VLGTAGSTALGVLGSSQQADALTGISNQLRADRAPTLAAFNNAVANPGSYFTSPQATGAVDAVLRKLSTNGNPAGNPSDLAKAAAYNLGGYNDYLRTLSGPAFGTANTEASTATNAASADRGITATLAGGLGSLTSPDNSLDSLLKKYGLGVLGWNSGGTV